MMEIGVLYKTTAMIAGLLGSLVGGMILPKLKLYRSLFYFGVLQLCAKIPYFFLVLTGKSTHLAMIVLFAEYFSSGMGTVALVVLLMSLCNRQLVATQYAGLSAIAMMARVMIGPIAGLCVLHFNWLVFYGCAFLTSVPCLMILKKIRKTIDEIVV